MECIQIICLLIVVVLIRYMEGRISQNQEDVNIWVDNIFWPGYQLGTRLTDGRDEISTSAMIVLFFGWIPMVKVLKSILDSARARAIG